MSHLLNVSRLKICRADQQLISDLSFTLMSGQCIHIQGANGSGKTTLLRVLAGLSWKDSGSICWEADYAFLGHKNALDPNLTAEETLAYFDEIQTQQQLLEDLGLVAMMNQRISSLSQGQQRKLAFAQLYTKRRRVWLLDEPVAAMDTESVLAVTKLIVAHLGTGGGVILTTHQPIAIPEVSVLCIA